MDVFENPNQVEAFLQDVDVWLTEQASLYLMGGAALTLHAIKPQTEDLDFGFSTTDDFQHVYETFLANGFELEGEPTRNIEGVGRSIKLYNRSEAVEVDIFERQVVGKVWITDRMRDRADLFWEGEYVKASVMSTEDVFLLKAVAGGDIGAGRATDLDDLLRTAQTDIDWDVVVQEIEAQRPFNTGSHEARLLREGSHPLTSIDIAVSHLPGLPGHFEEKIFQLGTEAQVEQEVIREIETGTSDWKRLVDSVASTVTALEDSNTDVVSEAVDRLDAKGIVEQQGSTLTLLV